MLTHKRVRTISCFCLCCITTLLPLLSTSLAAESKPEKIDFSGTICSPKLKHTQGERPLLAILWDYRDPSCKAPAASEVNRLLYGKKESVTGWFWENSKGKLTVKRAGVLGWYKADKPFEHYRGSSPKVDPTDKDGDGWLTGHTEKWTEAIHKADNEFDFAAYDKNQDQVLTSDELAILIVIPGNSPFGTNRPPVASEWPKREPLIVDGVRIPMIAEWYTGKPLNLGCPAHELCHLWLGTPDLYMYKPWAYAAGEYCRMQSTYTTGHLNPFFKLKLGWVPYRVIHESGTYRLSGIERSGDVLVLYDPARGPGEYFIIENRWRGNSYDAGVGQSGRGIRLDGLAVWHILEDPELWKLSNSPIGHEKEWGRRGTRLIRANGGDPYDDSYALFTKKGQFISDDTEPANLRWIDGSPSGFSIELLTDSQKTIGLKISFENNNES